MESRPFVPPCAGATASQLQLSLCRVHSRAPPPCPVTNRIRQAASASPCRVSHWRALGLVVFCPFLSFPLVSPQKTFFQNRKLTPNARAFPVSSTAGRKARLISESHPTFWAFWIRGEQSSQNPVLFGVAASFWPAETGKPSETHPLATRQPIWRPK